MLAFFATTTQGEQSIWVWVVVLGGLGLIGAVLYVTAARSKKGGGGSHPVVTQAGGAMLELQTLLEPGKRHVLEAKKQRKQADDSGDGEDPSAR